MPEFARIRRRPDHAPDGPALQHFFSAALIAHVEFAYRDEATKNRLATVVPHPNTDVDWLRTALGSNSNSAMWRADNALDQWLVDARLDGFTRSGEAPVRPLVRWRR